ncbi:MAG: SAP domain-containing protein [Nitrospirae bacterium]|nr:MAG: SAP domain-containing protein [Nitrospirota bacterium]
MKLDAIRKIGREMGVKTSNLKKTELIRAIQVYEGCNPCFDMQESCSQANCLWRTDCSSELK